MTADTAEGRIKDKLIRTKQEWAREGRLLTDRPERIAKVELSIA